MTWGMADFANRVTQYHNQENGTSLSECYSCNDPDTTGVTCVESMNRSCDGYRYQRRRSGVASEGTTTDFWTPNGGDYSANECGNQIDDTKL